MSTNQNKKNGKKKISIGGHILRIFYLFVGVLASYVLSVGGFYLVNTANGYLLGSLGIFEDTAEIKPAMYCIWAAPMLFMVGLFCIVVYAVGSKIWKFLIRKFREVSGPVDDKDAERIALENEKEDNKPSVKKNRRGKRKPRKSSDKVSDIEEKTDDESDD